MRQRLILCVGIALMIQFFVAVDAESAPLQLGFAAVVADAVPTSCTRSVVEASCGAPYFPATERFGTLSVADMSEVCNRCLPSLAEAEVEEPCIDAVESLIELLQRDCFVCEQLNTAEACAKKRLCSWDADLQRCGAVVAPEAVAVLKHETRRRGVVLGSAPLTLVQRVGTNLVGRVSLLTLPPVTLPLVPAATRPRIVLLPPLDECAVQRLVRIDHTCGQPQGSFARLGGLAFLQRRMMCSLCLSSMVSVAPGKCGSLAAAQASMLAECRAVLCPVRTPAPTKPDVTPTPTVSAPPPATTPPCGPSTCDVILLQLAAAMCGVAELSVDGLGGAGCHASCSFCLSAILTLAAGPCSAFAAIQATFSAQCSLCAPQPTPTTTLPALTPAPTAAATPAPTAPPTPAPTECSSSLLIAAGTLCGQVLVGVDFNNMTPSQCATLCSFCLSAVLAVSVGTCSTFASIQATFSLQCQTHITSAPTTTPAPPTPAPTTPAPIATSCEQQHLSVASTICGQVLSYIDFGSLCNTECVTVCSACLSVVASIDAGACSAFASIQAQFAAQCQLCAPTTTQAAVTPAPSWAVTPAPTYPPPACDLVLLQLATAICGHNLLSFNVSSMADEQCTVACSFCLAAVLSITAGTCGSFASIQASFSFQCQVCTPQLPPSPSATLAPPPHLPSCEDKLLHFAGLDCNTDLAFLSSSAVTQDNCAHVCTTCVSSILALPSCDCYSYSLIQSSVVQQCQLCLAAAPAVSSQPQP